MSIQIEAATERIPQIRSMTPQDFIEILTTRIESIQFNPRMSCMGLLVPGDSFDNQGRKKSKLIINGEDTEEEQVLTLVHEIAHFHFGNPENEENTKVEDFINDESAKFFQENQKLVLRAYMLIRLLVI